MRLIDAEFLERIKFHPLPYTHIVPSDTDAESYKRGWNDAIDAIMDNVPSAQPERKTGKWVHEIDTGADMLKCSACECRVIELEYKTAVGLQGFTYCPYCGAKMESGK